MVGTVSAASMDDADYRVVAKHLGHSTATQRRHYEASDIYPTNSILVTADVKSF